jgi:hypothetical protein
MRNANDVELPVDWRGRASGHNIDRGIVKRGAKGALY